MTQHAVADRIGRHSPPSRGLIIGLALGLAAIGIAVLIALIAVLARGGSTSSVSTTATQAPAVASAGQQAVPSGGQAKPGEGDFVRPAGAVRIGDMLFTVVSVKTLDIKPPEAHLKYVAVELTAQNVGQLTTGNWSIVLIDSDNAKNFTIPGSDEEERLRQLGGDSSYLSLVGIKPGTQVQGLRTFKMLADAKPMELQFSAQNGASGVIPLK